MLFEGPARKAEGGFVKMMKYVVNNIGNKYVVDEEEYHQCLSVERWTGPTVRTLTESSSGCSGT